jgi:hypothetical protein
MRYRASERSTVAYLWVRYEGHCLMHQRGACPHKRATLHLALPGHRADTQPAILRRKDPKEVFNPVEINEYARLRQPKVHAGHEALPTRQDFSLVAMLSEQGQGFFPRAWCVILEGGWLHKLIIF